MQREWSAEWTLGDLLTDAVPLAIGAALFGLARSQYEPHSPLLAKQRWRYLDLCVALAVITIGSFSTLLIIPSSKELRLSIIVGGTNAVLIIITVWSIVRWRHSQPWGALGFDLTLPTAGSEIVWALRKGSGAASIAAITVLSIRFALASHQSGHQLPTITASPTPYSGWIDFGGVYLVIAVLGPFAEEILFRGLAFGPLSRKFGVRGATIASAALWSLGHYSGLSALTISRMAWTLLIGIIFAEVYRRRASLIPPVVFHIIMNTASVVLRDHRIGVLVGAACVSAALWGLSGTLSHMGRPKHNGH